MVYKISRKSGRLPWQPNLGKKLHSSVLCKKSRNCSHVQWGLWGWWISIRYPNF